MENLFLSELLLLPKEAGQSPHDDLLLKEEQAQGTVWASGTGPPPRHPPGAGVLQTISEGTNLSGTLLLKNLSLR